MIENKVNDPNVGTVEPTTLRDYQWDAVQRLVGLAADGQRSLSLVTPTGAGKTVILQTLIEKLRPDFTGGVVAAPTVAIETGFRDDRVITYSKSRVAGHTSSFSATVGGDLFYHRKNAEDMKKKLKEVLTPVRPQNQSFVLTTHMQLALWKPKGLPADLTKKLLIIDEAHHAGSGEGGEDAYNKLGTFASEWYKRGGTVVYTSATPFRADGKDVLPEGTLGFEWTLARHAASGYAPAHLKPETVVVPGCKATSQADFSGDSQIEEADDIACGAMVDRWLADGKPKAVFIVPPGQGGQAGEWSANLMLRLQDPSLPGGPVRVVNGVGIDMATKDAFEKALGTERAAKTFGASQVDVFLACKRFDEGTDWSFCSHVYNWGVPSSFGLILQRWGRAFRLKCADYPTKHKDTATISFFVPSISGELLDNYEKTHHDHSLLLACYMADWKTGTEYRNALQIRFASARLEQRGEPQNEAEELEHIDYEQALVVPEIVRLQTNADICKLEASCQEANLLPPTHAEIVKHFEQQGASEETIHAVGVMLAEKLPPAEQTAVADKVARKMLTGWSAQNPVRPELREVFKEVVADYADRTHGVLGEVSRFYTDLTGVDSQNVAARLADMLVKPDLTEEMIIEAAKVYLDRTGELPGQYSGDATIDFGYAETWPSVHGAVRLGYRGLPGGTSLPKLLIKYGLKDDKSDLTEQIILAAVRGYLGRKGTLPSCESGDATLDFGFPDTWRRVDNALKLGNRGLPGGSSLGKFMLQHALKGEKPDLTEEKIVEAVRKFVARTGKLPSGDSSGDASEDFGFQETWRSIDHCLHGGYRGLPEGLSLAKLYLKHGLKAEKPDLTESVILAAAKRCQARTGRLPVGDSSKDATEDFGFPETWGSVNRALVLGQRGLQAKGSSLSELLINNHLKDAKPDLTEGMIFAACQSFLARTGRLPQTISGEATVDFGFPETWSAINGMLATGGRGLKTKGSSLSSLLKKHGLQEDKPDLTESMIFEAVQNHLARTGKLPKLSGDAACDFGFPETWEGVNGALRVGGRGLKTKSSSLSKFMFEHGLKEKKPDLTEAIMIKAAKKRLDRTGKLPSASSGDDATADFGFSETWASVNMALRAGGRGLPGGSSLSQLLIEHGLKDTKPDLTEEMIIEAAKTCLSRTGRMPSGDRGDNATADFGFPETWASVDKALQGGYRGLPGGSSLSQLLKKHGLR